MSRSSFLPFALPDVDNAELVQIQEALASGWVTTGPKTRQFEAEFAAAVGAKHAIAVNSCTAAMHLALEAMGYSGATKCSPPPTPLPPPPKWCARCGQSLLGGMS